MTHTQACVALGLAVVLLGGRPADATAQLGPPSRGTSNGVFGRRSNSAADRPSASLTGSLYGAYDNDIVAQLTNTGATGPRTKQSGPLYGGGVGLTFRRPGRVELGAAAQTGISYVPSLPKPSATFYGASGSLSTRLTGSTGFRASSRLEYAPRYSLASRLFEPFDDNDLPALDDGLQGLDLVPLASYRHHHQVGISQEVSRRGTLSAGYRFRRTTFTGVPRDLDVHRATLTYRHELARDLSARVGYGYQQSRHELGDGLSTTYSAGNIIASLDYDRGITLTMTRRTYVTFGFGTGVAQRETLNEVNAGGDSTSRLYVTGRAALLHEMGRTWSAEASYTRGLRFVDGFAEPLLTGNLAGQVGGLVTPRVEFVAFTRFALGSGISSGSDSAFHNMRSAMLVRYAVNRHMSIFSQVYHSLYEARGRQVGFPLLVPDYLNRLGVRFGISLWTSVLN